MNTDVSGDYIYQSKNTHHAFTVEKTEDCKYCHFLRYVKSGTTSAYDYTIFGVSAELIYECAWCGLEISNLKFSFWNYGSQTLQYCFGCHNSKNLFGCIGLRKKEYCILNKQYTKEEYEKLVPKIIEHMNSMPFVDKKGRIYKYGEFFPPELSPFAYNETIAQEYFPLIKEQAIEKGYKWKDPEPRNYNIDLKSEDLPDHIKDVSDDIVGKVISCQHQGKCQEQCTEAFKIIEPELQFYRRMNLPLPRLCPNCRHYQRLKQRNPLKLWHRKCMKSGCPNEFETSYAPDRKEIVYCEQCYQQEVV